MYMWFVSVSLIWRCICGFLRYGWVVMVRSGKVQLCGVNFSQREVEILAFLCNGRSHKFIANTFGLSVRTVETHARNIVIKSGAPSLEHLSDKLIQSGEMGFLLSVYTNALYADKFKDFLSDIVGESKVQKICLVSEFCDSGDINRIRDALSTIGCEVASGSSAVLDSSYSNVYVRVRKRDVDISKFDSIIDIAEYGFYLALLRYLRTVVRNAEVVDEQIDQYRLITNTSGSVIVRKNSKYSNWRELVKKGYKTGVAAAALSVAFVWNVLNGLYPRSDEVITNRDLFAVSEVMLRRPMLMDAVKHELSRRSPINVVSLVGIGGAGKTKLASMYMHSWDQGVAYQLNAETKESLCKSFSDLAESLANTDELKEDLKTILADGKEERRNGNILAFVRRQLKGREWLLVYDNVDDPRVIYDSFPSSVELWGKGSVIITTRDENIESYLGLGNNKAIKLGELSPAEQVKLFNMISNRLKNKVYDEEEILKLMKMVPAYPLDVTMVACCIAGSEMSVGDYIEKLRIESESFDSIDESLMSSPTEYGKTRYGIIVTTLNRVMDEIKNDQAMRGMLLLLSMCDSQNIPVEMFKRYGDVASGTKFLTTLKKYSFINQNANEVFIHRTVQDMWLKILTKRMTPAEFCSVMKIFTQQAVSFEDITYEYRPVERFSYEKRYYVSLLKHIRKICSCINGVYVDERVWADAKAHMSLCCGVLSLNGGVKFSEVGEYFSEALLLDDKYSLLSNYDRAVALLLEADTKYHTDLKAFASRIGELKRVVEGKGEMLPLMIACKLREGDAEVMLGRHDNGLMILDDALRMIPPGNEVWKQLAYARVKCYLDDFRLQNRLNDRELAKEVAASFDNLLARLDMVGIKRIMEHVKNGNVPGIVSSLMVEKIWAYNNAELYDEATNAFEEDMAFLQEYPVPKHEVRGKNYRCYTLLRQDKVADAAALGRKIYMSMKSVGYTSGIFEVIAELSEAYIRLGVYEDVLKIADENPYSCDSEGGVQRLFYARSLMNFAMAAHVLHDDVKAYKYYKGFLENVRGLCNVCLSKEDFAKLNEAGAFTPEAGETVDMKACLENARHIFTVIFGKDHAMVTGYLDKLKF